MQKFSAWNFLQKELIYYCGKITQVSIIFIVFTSVLNIALGVRGLFLFTHSRLHLIWKLHHILLKVWHIFITKWQLNLFCKMLNATMHIFFHSLYEIVLFSTSLDEVRAYIFSIATTVVCYKVINWMV